MSKWVKRGSGGGWSGVLACQSDEGYPASSSKCAAPHVQMTCRECVTCMCHVHTRVPGANARVYPCRAYGHARVCVHAVCMLSRTTRLSASALAPGTVK